MAVYHRPDSFDSEAIRPHHAGLPKEALIVSDLSEDDTKSVLFSRSAKTLAIVISAALTLFGIAFATGNAAVHHAGDVSGLLGFSRKRTRAPCLCAFDVDRTLLGYQDILGPKCPDNKIIPGVKDYAYLWATPPGYGNLTLSLLSQHLKSTFCSKCYVGIATAGGASGDGEKSVLASHLRAAIAPRAADILPKTWLSRTDQTESPPPFVAWCADKRKHLCTQKIVEWYKTKNVVIAPSDVYFFDDKAENILAFANSSLGFNAQQVSCASRNGSKGYCGGRPGEVQEKKGVHVCQTAS